VLHVPLADNLRGQTLVPVRHLQSVAPTLPNKLSSC
jgi:hypothetical protein